MVHFLADQTVRVLTVSLLEACEEVFYVSHCAGTHIIMDGWQLVGGDIAMGWWICGREGK